MLHAYYSSDAYIYSLPYIHDSQKITPYYARLVSTFWGDFPTLCRSVIEKCFSPIDWKERVIFPNLFLASWAFFSLPNKRSSRSFQEPSFFMSKIHIRTGLVEVVYVPWPPSKRIARLTFFRNIHCIPKIRRRWCTWPRQYHWKLVHKARYWMDLPN